MLRFFAKKKLLKFGIYHLHYFQSYGTISSNKECVNGHHMFGRWSNHRGQAKGVKMLFSPTTWRNYENCQIDAFLRSVTQTCPRRHCAEHQLRSCKAYGSYHPPKSKLHLSNLKILYRVPWISNHIADFYIIT